jgi:hypothetical protein
VEQHLPNLLEYLVAKQPSAHVDYEVVYSEDLRDHSLKEGCRGFYPGGYGPPSKPVVAKLPEQLNREVKSLTKTVLNPIDGLPMFSEKFSARAFIKGHPQTLHYLRRFAKKEVKTVIYPERVFIDWVQFVKQTESAVYALCKYVLQHPWTKSSLAVEAVKCFAFQFSSRRYEVATGNLQTLSKSLRGCVFPFLRIDTMCQR